MLEEITFARLQKLNLNVQEPEDLSIHGTIYSYDKAFDAVNTRNDKPLQIIDMVKYNTTTSDDPVIHSVSSQGPTITTNKILTSGLCVYTLACREERGQRIYHRCYLVGAYDRNQECQFVGHCHRPRGRQRIPRQARGRTFR